MHQTCRLAEKYRERITLALDPSLTKIPAFFSQPSRVPKLWYDMHNLETIVQQIFTPKLRMRVRFDEKTNQLKMHRMFVSDSTRKRFIPLPKDYMNDDYKSFDPTLDGASDILENNHQMTNIDERLLTIEQFNNDVLEQYT